MTMKLITPRYTRKNKATKLKLSLLALTIGLLSSTTNAEDELDTNLDPSTKAWADIMFSPTNAAPSNFIPPVGKFELIGASVSGLDSCDGDLGLSISKSFSDGTLVKIWENFDKIVDGMISTGGAIYLGSLYIQKSNPGLYKLITDGISLGFDDYLSALSSCEGILRAGASFVPDEAYEFGEYTALEEYLKENDMSQIDIVSFLSSEDADGIGGEENLFDEVEKGFKWYSHNEEGVVRVGGLKSDGSISYAEVTGVAARIGYCILRGVPEERCYPKKSVVGQGSATTTDPVASDPMMKVLFEREENKEPQTQVSETARKILGSVYTATCKECDTNSVAGIGIRGWYAEERDRLTHLIQQQLGKDLKQIKEDDLRNLSAPGSINVSLEHIRSLNLMRQDPYLQNGFIKGLAMDVAYARTIALSQIIQQQMLATAGSKATKDAKLDDYIMAQSDEMAKQTTRLIEELRSTGYKPRQYAFGILRYLESGNSGFIQKLDMFNGN